MSKLEKETILNSKSSRPNYILKIDDIINKYRTQIEQIKTNSTKNNQGPKSENLIILTNIPNRSAKEGITIKSDKITKENILDSQSEKYKISSEFIQEIQNDNIKLQSALTSEKLKVVQLNSEKESNEFELNEAKKEINELKNKLTYKENELIEQINNMNNINNNRNNDINKIKDENNKIKNIIQKFFEIFNKYFELLRKSNLIPYGINSKINYLENDYEGSNQKLSLFAIKSLDDLINKLLQDNKELYDQLVEIKKFLDQQNNLQTELDQMKNMKEEIIILNEKLKSYDQEIEIYKKENINLKEQIKELNEINNINNFIKNRIESNNMNINNNNQIYDNFNNNNNYNSQMLNFTPNIRNNYFSNYKNTKTNFFGGNNQNNLIINNENYNSNYSDVQKYNQYNENDFAFNEKENDNHEEKKLKKNKNLLNYNYNYGNKRNINMIKNISDNNINDYINNNVNNRTYYNTIESRKINLSELSNINNINNIYDNNNQNENKDFNSTGYGKSMDRFKNNILILEQQ